MPFSFYLPLPPSVNHIWRRGKGRTYLSANYSKWLKVAHAITLDDMPPRPLEGPVEVRLRAYHGKGWMDRKRDLDNLCKPILDFLVRRGVLVGDDHTVIKRVIVEVDPKPIPEAGVVVSVRDFEGVLDD